MPNPFFSNGGPGEAWLGQLNSWNQNRLGRKAEDYPVPVYDYMGIGASTEEMDIIRKILDTMLSPKGRAMYSSDLDKQREKIKNDELAAGEAELKKKRDPLGEADRVIRGY